MKKNSTTILFSLSILAVIFALGIFIFLFKVIENKNSHASKVLSTLSDKVIEKENMSTMSKKISEMEATQKKVKGYLVDPSHVDTFVTYLEVIGTDTNTEFVVKNINTIEGVQNKIFINVSIRGTFANIMNALTILENVPYQLRVTKSYLSKEETQQQFTADGKPKKQVNTLPTWRADIDFNILSS